MYGLVYEKRQGLGKPNLIYVGKIIHEEITDSENVRLQNRKNYDSRNGENTIQESENVRAINTNNIKTNIINTESINPNSEDELTEIKEQCQLSDFEDSNKDLLENVIDTLYSKDNLKVGNVIVNHYKILEKLKLITKQNLLQLLEISRNCKNIQNITNYLMICLYNNLGNKNIILSAFANKENCEKTNWDFLYDNEYYDSAEESS